MSLDGLRAWIGEVERKLGVRTRIFLVLTAIAIGGAGAGIYLALDAQSDRVDESDLQVAREELQSQIDAAGVATPEGGATEPDPRVEALEDQVRALQAQVESLAEGGTTAPSKDESEAGKGGGTPEAGGTQNQTQK